MSDLTPAASVAWRLAAAEAAAARHEYIECGHFLIGILSIEKLVQAGTAATSLDLQPEQLPETRDEQQRLEGLLQGASLQAHELRRALREALGSGSHDPAGKPMSRSPALKQAFRRAAQHAGGAPIGCLHFVAALADPKDPAVARALARTRSSAAELLKRTLAAIAAGTPSPPAPAAAPDPRAALIDTLEAAVQEAHAVKLRITPAAAEFLCERAFVTDDAIERRKTAQGLLQGALAPMVTLGKLQKSPAWQLVFEEGGLYLLPDE